VTEFEKKIENFFTPEFLFVLQNKAINKMKEKNYNTEDHKIL